MGRRGAKVAALAKVEPQEPPKPLRLDLGGGALPKEGFQSVDIRKYKGDEIVCNLGVDRWPFEDNSVDEVHSSNFLEHLTGLERCHFANELYRVLKPAPAGAVMPCATIVTPHWCAARAYGDPTHQWPPVTEWTYLYWNKAWRDVNGRHLDKLACDFELTQPTYTLHPLLLTRATEHQQERLGWAKEAAQDMIQVLIKREPKP